MNIKKVYVKCKDTTEKAVAVQLFGVVANTKRLGNLWAGYLNVFVDCEGDVDAVMLDTSACLTGKKEVTLDELFEAAKVGFKDPWEILPEGYRLVTDEEKEKHPHVPCKYHLKSWNYGKWFDDDDGILWNTESAYHAVPMDFVFDEKERKKAELVAKAQELLKQAEEL